MEQVIAEFISLPQPVIYAIFGALGGITGTLLGILFEKLFKTDRATKLIAIVCVLVSIQLVRHTLPTMQKSFGHIVVMKELKKTRLFQVIFRLHPEAEAEMQSKMKDILANVSDDQIGLSAQAASAQIVDRYLTKYLPSASSEAIYKLILRQLEVMKQFKSKPSLCMNYYLGQPQFKKDDLTPAFLEIESNVKADVIESAISTPSPLLQGANVNEIAEEIAYGYVQKGYPVDDLSKMDQIDKLPADQGCDIAIKFADVLTAMPADRSAYVFKSLLRLSQQQ